MPDQPPAVRRSLADKLDELFRTVHPRGKEHTYEQVASAIRESGGPTVSATYIWQLRKGLRDNPTKRHMEALAGFFGVPPAYFFDDEVEERVRAQMQLLATLRDRGVRQVATRAAGLSPRGLHAVEEMIKQIRLVEGLPAEPVPPGSQAEDSPPGGESNRAP